MVVYDTSSVADSTPRLTGDTRYPFKGNNSIIRLNGQTISADITIDSDENGVSAGPITQVPPSLLTVLEHRMTSVLNVDTIANKAGTGPVALTKQHAAKVVASVNGDSGTIYTVAEYLTLNFDN